VERRRERLTDPNGDFFHDTRLSSFFLIHFFLFNIFEIRRETFKTTDWWSFSRGNYEQPEKVRGNEGGE
jgi:hypothetical protein